MTSKSWLRYFELIGAAVIAVALVFKNPFELGVTLNGAISILYAIVLLAFGEVNRSNFWTRTAVLLFWAVLVFGIISTVIGAGLNRIDTRQAMRDLRDYGTICLVITAIWRCGKDRFGGWIIAGATLGMSVECLCRNYDSIYLMLFDAPIDGYRYMGGMLSPNEYGAYASVIATASLYELLRIKGWRKILSLIALTVSLFVVATSVSRGAMLGVAAGFVAVLCFNLHRVAVAVISAGLLFIAGLFVMRNFDNTDIGDQLHWRLNDTQVIGGYDERQELNALAMQMFSDNPVLGSGWGGFCHRTGGTIESPHNELLRTLSEGGFLSTVALSLAMLVPLVGTVVIRRNRRVLSPLFVSLLVFLVAEVFYSHLIRPGFGILFGVCLGYALLETGRESDSSVPVPL